LFAALDVSTGWVYGERKPTRSGRDFVAFLDKAVKTHRGKDIHVVLDNLSTHNTLEVRQWLADHLKVQFHFTPIGSSWINQIEIWFGIITRQSIRRGPFTSVKILIKQVGDCIEHWNADTEPFTWTATSEDILAKVRLTQTSIRKLVDNNGNGTISVGSFP
jgi:transposase